MLRLKKRAEFLAVARGSRAGRRAFALQCGAGPTTADDTARVGFTVTKKIGTATERNRIRRRLRAAVAALPADAARPGADYVIVGRREALTEPFPTLVSDLASAMRQAGRRAATRPGPAANPPGEH
jgi:ribonuclease P protein component